MVGEEYRVFDLDLPPVQFNGSESLLYQVWYNLIQNAVKFSRDGGTICIKLQQTEDKVVVCVADNGCGIDEESQKHIFDKFYQGNKAHASEQRAGTCARLQNRHPMRRHNLG